MTIEALAPSALLTEAELRATAETIAQMQEADGAIPWTVGEHVDVWNHVEAAMALLVAGLDTAADRAYQWCFRNQRQDGSWPMKLVRGEVEDGSGETNMSAYLAVGVWHHWLLRGNLEFVQTAWPYVERALNFVSKMQLPFGGIAWSQEGGGYINREALLAGSASIYQSLRAGVAIAELLGKSKPQWVLAGGRLGHALRQHRDLFMDKSEFSMDWYYPVLGGAVRGQDGVDLINQRWHEFVEPGLGIRCVTTNPWVTGAETCELAMSLDALGDQTRARKLVTDMQHLRMDDGSYWTGFVFPENVNWPGEQTTYTAAAVVLAVDALAEYTAGAGIMRGDTLAAHFPEADLKCGCLSD